MEQQPQNEAPSAQCTINKCIQIWKFILYLFFTMIAEKNEAEIN